MDLLDWAHNLAYCEFNSRPREIFISAHHWFYSWPDYSRIQPVTRLNNPTRVLEHSNLTLIHSLSLVQLSRSLPFCLFSPSRSLSIQHSLLPSLLILHSRFPSLSSLPLFSLAVETTGCSPPCCFSLTQEGKTSLASSFSRALSLSPRALFFCFDPSQLAAAPGWEAHRSTSSSFLHFLNL